MLDGDRPVALQVHGNFGPSEPGDVGVLAIRGGNGEEGCNEDGVAHFFGGSVKFCREQEGRLRFVELCLLFSWGWPEVGIVTVFAVVAFRGSGSGSAQRGRTREDGIGPRGGCG